MDFQEFIYGADDGARTREPLLYQERALKPKCVSPMP